MCLSDARPLHRILPDPFRRPLLVPPHEGLVERAIPLHIADVVLDEPVWLLSLDGVWFPSPVDHLGMGLILSQTAQPIRAGMSGSPIVQRGAAVGLVSNSHGCLDHEHHHEGFEPRLVRHLPGWLLAMRQVRREWGAYMERSRRRVP